MTSSNSRTTKEFPSSKITPYQHLVRVNTISQNQALFQVCGGRGGHVCTRMYTHITHHNKFLTGNNSYMKFENDTSIKAFAFEHPTIHSSENERKKAVHKNKKIFLYVPIKLYLQKHVRFGQGLPIPGFNQLSPTLMTLIDSFLKFMYLLRIKKILRNKRLDEKNNRRVHTVQCHFHKI